MTEPNPVPSLPCNRECGYNTGGKSLGLAHFELFANGLPARKYIPALKDFGAKMDASLSVHSVVVASAEQVSCPLDDEAAILNLKNSKYYGMNPVGTRIWSLLKEPRSVLQLRDTLLSEYDVDEKLCEQDLLILLEKMKSEGLIEVRSVAAS
jgi:hypothetical protein